MPKALGFLSYEAQAEGAIAYRPARAIADRGFGPFEVHPQKISEKRDGSVELRHNGDWIVIDPDGAFFAFKQARGGRQTAERFAASLNGSLPTRVVDLADAEHTSIHTAESVQAELDAKAAQHAAAE